MPKLAAFGFKIHTGWAMLVAVAGKPAAIEILLRQRLELLPGDNSIPRFVFHQAAELPLSKASALVKRAGTVSETCARLAIKTAVDALAESGTRVNACGVLSGSTIVPDNLIQILKSHPLIHAAEGALFVQAIVSACEGLGMSIASIQERQLWPRAASVWAVSEPSLRKRINGLRTSLGPPWSADHKTAAAAALFALKA
jgi:hypothetical protein